jgi:D-3-phosphoglycerate dehydrogenase / 2-oxoglutarate reductase
MTSVFQAEYKGDLAPYSYEREQLGTAGIGFSAAVCADGPELVERARGAEVIWLEWVPRMSREVLEALDHCELVVRWGVGYDQIDVDAATSLGVAVANAPTYCKTDVVEHTIGLVLALCRRIPERSALMRAGGWRDPKVQYRRLAGKTFGVIGTGRIGTQVAQLGRALGCRVLCTDIQPPRAPIEGVSWVGLEQLLTESDVVCAHASLNSSSRALLGERALALMKDDAILVNTSRGALVDEAALLTALQAGKFFGVGLDVFAEEPLPASHPLRSIERVVLTPHEAANSPESLAELRHQVCEATIEWLTTGWSQSVVNPTVKPRRARRGSHG